MVKKRRSLGHGFADEVAKVTYQSGHFQKGESPSWTDMLIPNFHPTEEHLVKISPWRIIFSAGLAAILFFIIFLRLFHLQIVQGRENRELADGNRIQVKIIHAPRGVIYDRNGAVLAANSPAFRLDAPGGKHKLITRETALEWEVKNDPRFQDLEIDNIRRYPYGEQFAHVVGYMGEISENQLKKEEFKGYRAGDQVGQYGLEAQYEKILRGIDGGEIIEVDSKGRKIRSLRRETPIPGKNLYLSIDASLQMKIYDIMKDALEKLGRCCGSYVAEDPLSGKILSLGSFPVFDPNIFSKNDDEATIADIFSRKDSPVLNRAIGGVYPPGSTFKIVTSAAALASGKINADTNFEDTGVMYLGPYKFSNWYFNQYGKTEGAVNLQKALQRSNDTYFYRVAQITGEKILSDWAKKLKLGAKLGIDLPGEEEGLVPDDEWKRKTYKESWYPGDTLHMAIGQGFVLATPLQILGITSFIASGGNLYEPQMIKFDKPKLLVSGLFPKDQITLIQNGLKLVPKAGGTAWPFFTFPIPTAGKTGTAEYGPSTSSGQAGTHAWYTSFAPANDPKIALTVLIEGGGEGSSVAAPIAKEAYRFYFSPDKNNLIQDVWGSATESGRALGE